MLFGYILSSWGLVSNYNTQKIWIRTAERQLSSPAVGKSHTGTVRLTVSYPLVAGEQRLRGHTLRDSPTCLAAAGSRTWAFSVVSRVCYPLHYKVCVCVCVLTLIFGLAKLVTDLSVCLERCFCSSFLASFHFIVLFSQVKSRKSPPCKNM